MTVVSETCSSRETRYHTVITQMSRLPGSLYVGADPEPKYESQLSRSADAAAPQISARFLWSEFSYAARKIL
jgi:hypothetical protein